jgi:uncharacterized RDD family membrane protein YckC
MNKEYKVAYASFWRRAVSYILDSIFLFSVFYLLTTLLAPLGSRSKYGDLFSDFYFVWFFSAYFVLLILYTSIQQSSKHKATFGMRIMKLKIYTSSMKKIGFWRSFIRTTIFLIASIHYISIIPSFLMVVFLEKKQGLHDLLCRTVVTVEEKKN